MIVIKEEKTDRTTRYTECPFCEAELSFGSYSTVYCAMCKKELPNFSELISSLIGRLTYYKKGA